MAESLLSVIDAIIRGRVDGPPPAARAGHGRPARRPVGGPGIARDGRGRRSSPSLPLASLAAGPRRLHTSTFDSSKAGFEVRARAAVALCGLLQELS